MSLHGLLISLHAAAGTAAFAFGAVAIWRPRPLPIYLLALIACILLLAYVIAIDWGGLGSGTRALYLALALALLGAYTIWCGLRALVLQRRGMAKTGAYLDSLGFTLVALLDAFAVILVLRLGAPTWATVITGLAVAAVGNRGITARKRHLPPAPPCPATARGHDPARTPTPSPSR
jgi:hypothetical protein